MTTIAIVGAGFSGTLLAYLAIGYAVPLDRAVDPTQMYLVAYNAVFSQYGLAVAATALFVFVSQLKINVTNVYAGSLAWSNFFAQHVCRALTRHAGFASGANSATTFS